MSEGFISYWYTKQYLAGAAHIDSGYYLCDKCGHGIPESHWAAHESWHRKRLEEEWLYEGFPFEPKGVEWIGLAGPG
jgi:hypothetical protein